MLEKMTGATKPFVNDMARKNAQMAVDWMGVSLEFKADGTEQTFENNGNDVLLVGGGYGQEGAQVVKEPAAAAVSAAIF